MTACNLLHMSPGLQHVTEPTTRSAAKTSAVAGRGRGGHLDTGGPSIAPGSIQVMLTSSQNNKRLPWIPQLVETYQILRVI